MNRRAFLTATAAGLAGVLLPGMVPLAEAAGPETVADANAAVLARLATPGPPLARWRWIVFHHTAAENATLDGMSRYHANRFGDPLGIEYHFIVNNGRKKPLGLIEVGRWRHQARAIHLFHPERALDAIAVTLVGNFEQRRPRAAQIDALVLLTRALMRLTGIEAERVTTHRRIDGRLTQCPGKHFPYDAVRARLVA